MEPVLERAVKRGITAEILRVSSRETSIEFENNRLKRADSLEQAGLAIRVIAGGRLGFAASSLPADEMEVLDRAVALSAYGKEVQFDLPGPSAGTPVEVFDESLTSLGPEELAAQGEELIAPLRSADPRFKAGVSLSVTDSRITLANTKGYAEETRKTVFGGTVGGILVEGENFLELFESYASCRRTGGLLPRRDRVLTQLNQGRQNVAIKSGNYPVLFTPTAHATMLGPLLACLNGKAVQKGMSPFRGRLAEAVFSPSFTLTDDPTRPNMPPSSPHDGEGLPGAAAVLIDRGVIAGFLLDLDTASALGMKPNGNGRRSGWSAPPAPGASTLEVAAGGTPWMELLAGIREGLLVHHLIGAGQSNPYGGVISANIGLGFLVRGGEVVGRVKNTMLTANTFDLLRDRIASLSCENEEVGGRAVLPYLLADGIAITAKED